MSEAARSVHLGVARAQGSNLAAELARFRRPPSATVAIASDSSTRASNRLFTNEGVVG